MVTAASYLYNLNRGSAFHRGHEVSPLPCTPVKQRYVTDVIFLDVKNWKWQDDYRQEYKERYVYTVKMTDKTK